jgi:hypothetical protein
LKTVGHWILFILKTIAALLLLPFGLLYVWFRWRIARCAFIGAAKKTGMDRTLARSLAHELSPGNMMRIGDKFTDLKSI